MIINFDARCIQDEGYAEKGIGNFARFLLETLLNRPGVKVQLAVDPRRESIKCDPRYAGVSIINLSEMTNGVYINPSFMTHEHGPLLLAKNNGLKLVGVIHDLIPIRRPYESSTHDLEVFRSGLKMSTSLDRVIAVSCCTKSDYLDQCDLAPPTFVFHANSRFRSKRPVILRNQNVGIVNRTLERPYIFYAVADHPRKNVEIALRSAEMINRLGYSTLIGGGISSRTIRALTERHCISQVDFMPRLTDAELEVAYARSAAVVVPSFDEGFSLPVTEAGRLGCRILVSDISAHREQVLDQRSFFDPADEHSLVAAFHKTQFVTSTTIKTFDHRKELDDVLQDF